METGTELTGEEKHIRQRAGAVTDGGEQTACRTTQKGEGQRSIISFNIQYCIILASRRCYEKRGRGCRFANSVMGIDPQTPNGEFGPFNFKLTDSLCSLCISGFPLLKPGGFSKKINP